MGRKFRILSLVLLAFLLAACSSRPKVIPKKTMILIYEEMLMADQWINDNYSERPRVDTSLFYEPIFRKYGFTTDDYIKSVGHYMRDPEGYVRIIEQVKENLRLRGKHYDELQAAEAGIDSSGEYKED